MIAAMRKANFKSMRGQFKYNVNHFPIQNFYLLKAVKGPSGDDRRCRSRRRCSRTTRTRTTRTAR